VAVDSEGSCPCAPIKSPRRPRGPKPFCAGGNRKDLQDKPRPWRARGPPRLFTELSGHRGNGQNSFTGRGPFWRHIWFPRSFAWTPVWTRRVASTAVLIGVASKSEATCCLGRILVVPRLVPAVVRGAQAGVPGNGEATYMPRLGRAQPKKLRRRCSPFAALESWRTRSTVGLTSQACHPRNFPHRRSPSLLPMPLVRAFGRCRCANAADYWRQPVSRPVPFQRFWPKDAGQSPLPSNRREALGAWWLSPAGDAFPEAFAMLRPWAGVPCREFESPSAAPF